MRILRALVILVLTSTVLLCVAVYLLAFWPLRDKHPLPTMPTDAGLVITGARIYPAPDAPAIVNGTIVAQGGKITAVGTNVAIPAGAKIIACHGCIVTAGFWNAHVHFTQRKWSGRNGSPRRSFSPRWRTC